MFQQNVLRSLKFILFHFFLMVKVLSSLLSDVVVSKFDEKITKCCPCPANSVLAPSLFLLPVRICLAGKINPNFVHISAWHQQQQRSRRVFVCLFVCAGPTFVLAKDDAYTVIQVLLLLLLLLRRSGDNKAPC